MSLKRLNFGQALGRKIKGWHLPRDIVYFLILVSFVVHGVLERGPVPSVDCPFYFEDSYRKATRRACRLIARNPQSEPWQPGLCRSCPVPGLLKANPCIHLALEARVVRKWGGLVARVEPYTVCSAKLVELSNPHSCWRGCDQFTAPGAAAGNIVSVDELMKTVVPEPRDS